MCVYIVSKSANLKREIWMQIFCTAFFICCHRHCSILVFPTVFSFFFIELLLNLLLSYIRISISYERFVYICAALLSTIFPLHVFYRLLLWSIRKDIIYIFWVETSINFNQPVEHITFIFVFKLWISAHKTIILTVTTYAL